MQEEFLLPNTGGATICNKLTKLLIKELQTGEFAACSRLPAELELAEKYKVSRTVIRDVLANLEREGLVERGRGVGTIIHRQVVNLANRLDLKLEYNELIHAAGFVPKTDNVKLFVKPAEEELAERLEVDCGTPIIVCEKRIFANEQPVIYSVDCIPAMFFGNVDYVKLDWNEPVFDLLEAYCGIVVDTEIAKITATTGTKHVRAQLQLKPEEAVLLIDELGYFKLRRPIMQTYAFYTNFFDFAILRKKL